MFAICLSFICLLAQLHTVTGYLGVKGTANGAFRGFYVNRFLRPYEACSGEATGRHAYVLIPPPQSYSNARVIGPMLLRASRNLAEAVARRSRLTPRPDVIVLVPHNSTIHAFLAPAFHTNGLLRESVKRSSPTLRAPRLVVRPAPAISASIAGGIMGNRTRSEFAFFPLAIFGLTQYKSVVALHPGARVVTPPDILFSCTKDFMYASAREGVVSDTLYVARPSLQVLGEMEAAARERDAFSTTRGWFGQGFVCRENGGVVSEHKLSPLGDGACEGKRLLQFMDGPQGFLWAYWTFRVPQQRSAALCPCMFAYDQGYMCTVQTFGKSLVVRHGTGLEPCGARGRLRSEGCLAVPQLSYKRTHERLDEGGFPCRPTFFIIGVRKGGTTDLYVRLTRHPQVVRNSAWYMDKEDPVRQAQTGETFYFQNRFAVVDDLQFVRRIQDKRFPNCCDADKGEITGESTVSYLAARHIPEVMLRVCPESSRNFRLIVLMRDPIERAISLHQMRVRLGCGKGQAGANCTGIEERLGGHLKELGRRMDRSRGNKTVAEWMWEGKALFDKGYYNMLYEGLYVLQLTRWLRYFPRTQIMLICSEHLWDEGQGPKELDKVQRFLRLEPHRAVTRQADDQPANSGKKFVYDSKHVLPPDSGLYRELVEFHAPWNKVLKEEFGASCSWLG